MLSGSLMLTFDDQGYRYDLPVYVINEAVKYGSEKSAQKLPENFKGEEIEVTFRCSKYKDTVAKVNTGWTCSTVKAVYQENVEVPVEKIRMFFNGKELKNEGFLHQFKVNNGVVLQVFVQN